MCRGPYGHPLGPPLPDNVLTNMDRALTIGFLMIRDYIYYKIDEISFNTIKLYQPISKILESV
jgi:hypothetical protein